MELSEVTELAVQMPHLHMGVVYTHLWKCCEAAQAQGCLLRVSGEGLRAGSRGNQPLSQLSKPAIMKAVVALDNLQLIHRSSSFRDGQTIQIAELSPKHRSELLIAMRRLSVSKNGRRIYLVLQKVTIKSSTDWELCKKLVRGQEWGAEALFAKHAQPEITLFGLATDLYGSAMSPSLSGDGASQAQFEAAQAQESESDPRPPLPKEENLLYRAACAAQIDGEEVAPSKQGEKRRRKLDEKRAAKDARSRAMVNGELPRMPVASLGGSNADKQIVDVPQGANEQRSAQEKSDHRKGESSKPICILDWHSWSEVDPILNELFGEGCIRLSQEQRNDEGLVITRPGMLLEDESGVTPEHKRARQILVLLHDGYRVKGFHWGYPSRYFAVTLLRALKYYRKIFGEKPGHDAYQKLRMLAGWTKQRGGNCALEDVLPAIAGFALRIIDAKISEKPHYKPKAVEWRDILLNHRVRNISALDDAVESGRIAGAVELLEAMPDGPLRHADILELEELFGSAESKSKAWKAPIPNVDHLL